MRRPARRWVELAAGVWACRHDDLDLTTGVIVGEQAILVVDTGADLAAGAGLLADIGSLLPGTADLPLSVVYTHAHYDHCFGTEAFAPTAVRAHVDCRTDLQQTGLLQRDNVVAQYRGSNRDAAAERIARVDPVIPDRVFETTETVELGARDVSLLHLGRGHTDHDVLVLVPDADVLFAGDLLENGAPPAFEGSFPVEWPVTLTRLLDLLGPAAPATIVVPGHGDPVDAAFVAAQRDELLAVAEACRSGRVDDGPYPPAVLASALTAYAARATHARATSDSR